MSYVLDDGLFNPPPIHEGGGCYWCFLGKSSRWRPRMAVCGNVKAEMWNLQRHLEPAVFLQGGSLKISRHSRRCAMNISYWNIF